jgi:uncharacterized protein (DUF1501 family)
MINRRTLLSRAALGGAALMIAPGMAIAAANTDKRFIFIIQRGAADGLGTIIPMGDPDLVRLRAGLIAQNGLKLDSMFTAHPSLVQIGQLFGLKEALFAHAVASPYRDRSHFDAQNVLETGGDGPYQLRDGWLNRLLSLLPKAEAQAIALSATIPVALRGKVDVASYAPSGLGEPRDDLKARIGMLYAQDAQLRALWDSAMNTEKMAGDAPGAKRDPAATGALAAKMLTGPGSARIAMIETLGWDTHFNQPERLTNELKSLDTMVAAIHAGLGAEWTNTLILVATEFGRTAAMNGTNGSDHGTASAAMLIGGAVKGGRVMADWPGLSQSALYENRDLKPTMALDQLIAVAMAEHFGLDYARTGAALFPQMATGSSAPAGLIRS